MGGTNAKVITMKEALNMRGYNFNNEIIGMGGNGLICAIDKDNTKYAAKLQIINDKKRKKQIKREKSILEQLQGSEHVIQMEDNFQYKDFDSGDLVDVIVMEKMDVDLMTMIEDNIIPLQIKKWIFYQICMGIKECHSQSIWHLDIKADNVLVNANLKKMQNDKWFYRNKENIKDIKVRITDFGHARRSGDKKIPKKTGTEEYMPPESIKCQKKYLPSSFRGDKMDIWSLGVLLFTLITGYFPYKVDKDGERMFHLIGENLNRFVGGDEECRDLLEKMLCEDPKMRSSIDEILSHDWFKNM